MTRRETGAMLRLAAPLIFTQVGMIFYSTVDMLFVGRLGAQAIAGVGLGGTTVFTLAIAGMGVVMGVDSPASKAVGAGRDHVWADFFVHALATAALAGIPLFVLTFAAGPFFRLAGVDAAVAAAALDYIRVLRFVIFPFLLFAACRQCLQAADITRPQVAAIIFGNIINALFNYVFIFGRWGFPAFGIQGSALATVAANLFMLSVAAAAARRRLHQIGWHFSGFKLRIFEQIFSLGIPTGLQFIIEVGSFSLATVLIGRLGAQILAAHQLTLNFASMTFMVPVGIAHAAAVRVGQWLGRDDERSAARAGTTALCMATAFMATTSLIFAYLPRTLLGFFTADAAALAMGARLLHICALFQIFDGAQVTLTGALRGWGRTRLPMWANFAGHWLLGLPIGIWLCFQQGWGAVGLWSGLCLGLMTTALLLGAQWLGLARRALAHSS